MNYFFEQAQNGDQYAQFRVGKQYITNKDKYEEGMEWLEKAAIQGSVSAQLSLIKEFEVKDNKEAALFWAKKAADSANIDALVYVVKSLLGEKDISENSEMLLRYAESLINLKHPIGFFVKGQAYVSGWGVEKDFNIAKELLFKAAEKGFVMAFEQLALLEKHFENEKESARWRKEYVNHHFRNSGYDLT